MKSMVYISISLSKDLKKEFEKLCAEETRGKSAQFVHMLKHYKECRR